MTRYLLSVYQPDGDPPPPEVLGPVMREVESWGTALREAGAWVFAGGLFPPSTATVVRPRDGDLLITDGPFVEGKEHVGGFTVINVADLDAALLWAGRLSTATGLPTEIQPLRDEA